MKIVKEVLQSEEAEVKFVYDVDIHFSPPENELEEFFNFVERVFGMKPSPIQRFWAKKFFTFGDVILNAFTGYGKSTFLLWLASYMSSKGKRVLFLTTSTTTKEDIERRIRRYLGHVPFTVLAGNSPKDRQKLEEMVIKGETFDLIIVDDVDAVTSFLPNKTQALVVNLLLPTDERGRNREEIIKKAWELFKLGRRFNFLLSRYLHAKEEEEVRESYEELLAVWNEIKEIRSKKVGNLLVASATMFNSSFVLWVLTGIYGGVAKGKIDVPSIYHYLLEAKDVEDVLEKLVKVVKVLGPGGIVFVSPSFVRRLLERVEELCGKDVALNIARVKTEETKKKYLFDCLVKRVSRETGLRAVSLLKITDVKDVKNLFKDYDIVFSSISVYGKLIRGVEDKERLKYVVFLGFPSMTQRIGRKELTSWVNLLELLLSTDVQTFERKIVNTVCEKAVRLYGTKITSLVFEVRKAWSQAKRSYLKFIHKFKEVVSSEDVESLFQTLTSLESIEELPPSLRKEYEEMKEALEKLAKSFDKLWKVFGKEIIEIDIPLVKAYFQASGRTGRVVKTDGTHLYLTAGASVIIEFRPELASWIKAYMKAFLNVLDENNLVPALGSVRKELEESRKGEGIKVPIKVTGVIVESPKKTVMISRMFGPAVRYSTNSGYIVEVATRDGLLVLIGTAGHFLRPKLENKVKEVSEKKIEAYGILLERKSPYKTTFNRLIVEYVPTPFCPSKKGDTKFCPDSYEVIPFFDRKVFVKDLVTFGYMVDDVVVMTDNDEEGEKIGFDVYSLITHFNPTVDVKRGRYTALAKHDVENAIKNPDTFKVEMLLARTLREVDDVLIGLPFSNLLSVASFFSTFIYPRLSFSSRSDEISVERAFVSSQNHSIGRVQTTVLSWIYDRTEKSEKSKTYFVVVPLFGRRWFIPLLPALASRFNNLRDVRKFVLDGKLTIEVVVKKTERKVVNSPPPFDTATALNEISSLTGLPSSFVSQALEVLYLNGIISYPRTDTNLISPTFFPVIDELAKTYGVDKELSNKRRWVLNKEAHHQAIIPVAPIHHSDVALILSPSYAKVYSVIVARTLASQIEKKLEFETVKGTMILRRNNKTIGLLDFEVPVNVDEKGWAITYEKIVGKPLVGVSEVKDVEVEVKDFDVVKLPQVPKFKDYEVIQLMKERKIGRPSTYAETLDVLARRGYIVITEKTNTVISTRRAVQPLFFLETISRRMEISFSPFAGELENVTRKLLSNMDKLKEVENEKKLGLLFFKTLTNDVESIQKLLRKYEKVLRLF